jgi:hypothetical protein
VRETLAILVLLLVVLLACKNGKGPTGEDESTCYKSCKVQHKDGGKALEDCVFACELIMPPPPGNPAPPKPDAGLDNPT